MLSHSIEILCRNPHRATLVIHIVSPSRAGSMCVFTMTRLSTSFNRMYPTASLIACMRFTSALTKFSVVRMFVSISVMSSTGPTELLWLGRGVLLILTPVAKCVEGGRPLVVWYVCRLGTPCQ